MADEGCQFCLSICSTHGVWGVITISIAMKEKGGLFDEESCPTNTEVLLKQMTDRRLTTHTTREERKEVEEQKTERIT